MLAFGVCFQLPGGDLLPRPDGADRSQETCWRSFRYAVVGIFVVAALITPPDILTQSLLALPLVGLYGVGIVVAKDLLDQGPLVRGVSAAGGISSRAGPASNAARVWGVNSTKRTSSRSRGPAPCAVAMLIWAASIRGYAVGPARDRGEREGAQPVLLCQIQARADRAGEGSRPDRDRDGRPGPRCGSRTGPGSPKALGDPRLAGGTAHPELVGGDRCDRPRSSSGPRRLMDRTVDPTATEHRRVGRVHDRVHVWPG